MVSCPHCGESVPEGVAVCSHCGAALESAASEPQAQPEQEPESQPEPQATEPSAAEPPAAESLPAEPQSVEPQPAPAVVGTPPPDHQYPNPNLDPSAYSTSPVPAAPVVRRPPLITMPDVFASLRDALAPLLIVMVLTFGVVAGLATLLTSTGHGGFHDWLISAVILTAGAFGAPSSLSTSSGGGSGASSTDTGGLSFALSENFEINLAAWIITFSLIALWAWRAKRREAAAPSTSPGQAVARSALSAVGVSLVLLILALVSKASDLYGLGTAMLGGGSGIGSSLGNSDSGSGTVPFGSSGTSGSDGLSGLGSLGGLGSSGGTHASFGVQPGWVFVGPLLVALFACLVGRLAAIARRPAGDPGGEWIRKLIAPWRAAAVVVKTQAYAVAVLVGPTVLIYAEYHLFNEQAPGRVKAAVAIVGLLLLPNFAVGGILTGFGVTLFAGAAVGGVLSGVGGAGGLGIGLFGDSRPWLVWLLIGEAVLGTAFPWILVRTRRRAVEPTAFAPAQVWRAALLGAVGAFLIATLGQASLSGSVSMAAILGSALSVGLTYSIFGSILAGVLWCSAAYLAVALQVTPRVPAAQAQAEVAPPVQYGWPGTQAAPAVPGVPGAPVDPQLGDQGA